ncbi:hypothetical protein HZQ11_13520 [Elizabethkingia anophelis]|uniref:Uncharacterized protein n=1 Tax=Elizabethkingia anophelis TaxID=1117645 RepID=A0A455ZEB5_9FLAO|nr:MULTISPECIES: hypothetical protein [Elizabethkingia]KUF46114.1 hypothetical protein AS358_10315 [Elizabethkingia anophelis]MCT3644236.1 hypothetical protein [Elizabethkingia anophelis]MCT3650505.1 hypothetical protein [Elizabethkingia anophelis]MCT3656461.1 hypothetical protein [Elizabethkingia anophelis]MCT3658007.1 hypothetical protein [Elizabethkingia anophelis]
MEKLDTQQAAIELGKQFVNQHGLNSGVDTFGRWMCHYIAEQMVKADNSVGAEKELAEKACFETILKFWQHRWQLPSGIRPFESFDTILSVIERLDPERHRNFYYHQIPSREDTSIQRNAEQKKWIKFAEDIDKAARVCIELAIEKCAEEARDEETENWLKYGSKVQSGIDVKIIGELTDLDFSSLLDDKQEGDDLLIDSKDQVLNKYEVAKIKSRIEHIENLSKMNSIILKELKSKLKKIEK